MNKLSIVLICILVISCHSVKNVTSDRENIAGYYVLKTDKLYQVFTEKNYSILELSSDGTYTLYKAVMRSYPIEQCDYASKGKWSVIAPNVIEITSENYYQKQQGFEYNIIKESKFSQDSLYIKVIFPTNFHPVELNFKFDHDFRNIISTTNTEIVLPKQKIFTNNEYYNAIALTLNANYSGREIYKSRMKFNIFDERISVKYNYLTITLPYFDICFFEFEPYNQELMLLKNSNKIIWQGEVWIKTQYNKL